MLNDLEGKINTEHGWTVHRNNLGPFSSELNLEQISIQKYLSNFLM